MKERKGRREGGRERGRQGGRKEGRMAYWKGRNETSFNYRQNDSAYRKIIRELQNTIRTNNQGSKVSGYKINIQKPTVFFYISNEQNGNKIKNTIVFRKVQKQ